MKEAAALHPDRFGVNEAWIAFQLNDTPVGGGRDGSFNCFALMDAASRFILSMEMVAVHEDEPPPPALRRMLQTARTHSRLLPAQLLVPEGRFTEVLPAQAERAGIVVVRVPESQLLVFIGGVRQAMAARMGPRRRARKG